MQERPVKFSLNPTATEPWLKPIGRLITNFGAVELQTYWWIAALTGEKDQAKKTLQARTNFSRRVDFIVDQLEESRWEVVRSKAQDCWSNARGMAKFRNAFAHSPLVFFVPDDDRLPPWVRTLDVGRLKRPRGRREPLATLDELNTKVIEIADLATELSELLKNVDRIAGESNQVPSDSI